MGPRAGGLVESEDQVVSKREPIVRNAKGAVGVGDEQQLSHAQCRRRDRTPPQRSLDRHILQVGQPASESLGDQVMTSHNGR